MVIYCYAQYTAYYRKEWKTMDYKKDYSILFNTITDVIEILESGVIFPNIDDAINKLKLAQ